MDVYKVLIGARNCGIHPYQALGDVIRFSNQDQIEDLRDELPDFWKACKALGNWIIQRENFIFDPYDGFTPKFIISNSQDNSPYSDLEKALANCYYLSGEKITQVLYLTHILETLTILADFNSQQKDKIISLVYPVPMFHFSENFP